MLKFTNHSKDSFVQETSLLSATLGGPTIKKKRLFTALLPEPAIFFITVTIQNKFKVFIFLEFHWKAHL